MVDPDAVCVLIPALNEAETIGDIIDRFRAQGFEHLLVVDGGSTDGTAAIAAERGARVVEQSGSGKGQAIREGLDRVDRPYVVMMDGDGTYRPEEADRLLEPLAGGRADHVIGDRFADVQPGAMTRLNRIGNRVINRAFGAIHGRPLGDILSGYRAFTRDSIRSLSLTADGFGIETEMAVECVKHGVSIAVVPISYGPRPEASETNLRPFRDGGHIILTLYTMAKTNNPLFYFGSVGTLSILTGLVLAAWVAIEWVTRGISHEVIAVVSGVAVLLGIQLVMFGVLSDLIVTVNREQTRQFERLAGAIGDGSAPTARGTEFGSTPAEVSDGSDAGVELEEQALEGDQPAETGE